MIVVAFIFLNVWSYSVERTLFAIYFHQEFGWGSAWAGAAQAAGNLVAAAILFVCRGSGASDVGAGGGDDGGQSNAAPLDSGPRHPASSLWRIFVSAPHNLTSARPDLGGAQSAHGWLELRGRHRGSNIYGGGARRVSCIWF